MSVSTLAPDTSLPVPDVVGQSTSPIAGGCGTIVALGEVAARLPPWSATIRAALATSSAEPPPMPTTACSALRPHGAGKLVGERRTSAPRRP